MVILGVGMADQKLVSLPDCQDHSRGASAVRDHTETLSGISLKRCPASFETLSAIV